MNQYKFSDISFLLKEEVFPELVYKKNRFQELLRTIQSQSSSQEFLEVQESMDRYFERVSFLDREALDWYIEYLKREGYKEHAELFVTIAHFSEDFSQGMTDIKSREYKEIFSSYKEKGYRGTLVQSISLLLEGKREKNPQGNEKSINVSFARFFLDMK